MKQGRETRGIAANDLGRRMAVLGLAIGLPALAADFSGWRHTQPVEVTGSGLQSLTLPPQTLNLARASLDDLRVISPSGAETPFVIHWPEPQPVRLVAPKTFGASLGAGVTELKIETGTTEPIRAINLRPAAAKFLKALRVETSSDGANWQSLRSSAIIFREPGDAESTRIELPPRSHTHLRLVIDDQTSDPVAFSAADLELDAFVPDNAPLATSLKILQERQGRTHLTIDLGARNVFIATIRIKTSDPVFSRRVKVTTASDDPSVEAMEVIASSTIFRVALGTQTSYSLEMPVHRVVAGDKLILEIADGDSPPLKIDAVEVTQHPVRALFHAGETGWWQLMSGNPLASAPRYDIAAVKQQLASAPARPVTAGSATQNESYEKPTALPEAGARGTGVDVKRCRFRKHLVMSGPGVLEIELDTEVLSHADTSLDDLRLVQNGRQIPFIIDRPEGPSARHVEPAMAVTPDEKRPGVTVWTLTMPLDGLPAERFTCSSSTPLFDRRIEARAEMKDAFGNETEQVLGAAHWVRKPGDAASEFEIGFNRMRLPKKFTLQTNDGDNAPVEIANLRVYHPVVRLITNITQSSPVFVYYGNDRATPPRYDLQLMHAELATAPKEAARLGEEETLSASQEDKGGTGSPWLWAALAVVTVVLLWVVAKMLPSFSEGRDSA